MVGAGAADGYALATWLFLRALGVIYLVAFASFAVQARGLVGERGIVPARRLLAEVGRDASRGSAPLPRWRAYLGLPTLAWWRSGDRSLLVASTPTDCAVATLSRIAASASPCRDRRSP
jgi:hypothetical protein